uniref:Secreted protein n=1 Tax=Romanomermis culicivorax TaxID=13658 RepID=A0A915ILH6_ROMCU
MFKKQLHVFKQAIAISLSMVTTLTTDENFVSETLADYSYPYFEVLTLKSIYFEMKKPRIRRTSSGDGNQFAPLECVRDPNPASVRFSCIPGAGCGRERDDFFESGTGSGGIAGLFALSPSSV